MFKYMSVVHAHIIYTVMSSAGQEAYTESANNCH